MRTDDYQGAPGKVYLTTRPS